MSARIRVIVCAAAVALGAWPSIATAQAPDRKPKLVVLLMVDQMRGDYVDRFQSQWTGGLHRLVAEGAWFRDVNYPYFNTVTCAGHATVGTGSLPSTHGMIMNDWWDRSRRAEVACTEDSTVTPISYGRSVSGPGDSAAHLRISTLSDELRAQSSPGGHVIGFSLKARAAITLAGHRPDAVAWFDDSGAFVTSTAFSQAPLPAVGDFIHRHPVEGDFGKVWDRSLPREKYLYEDTAVGVMPPKGMTPAFPHALNGGGSAMPDRLFYDEWQSSPYADEYLAQMALDVAQTLRLGQGTATDMMAIGFSTLDKVGHDYGPNSHEIQDVLVRLDRTLSNLFAGLDRLVGSGNYTVALTADHGVPPTPERSIAQGLSAGRVSTTDMGRAVDTALQRSLGQGKYVAKMLNNELYLEAGVFDRMRRNSMAVAAVKSALLAMPGVVNVFMRDEIASGQFADDSVARRIARGYDAERSGDIVVVLAPYWIEGNNATSHGSPYGFDTHVPLFLMGKGIVPGEYLMPASPADVAPTLAFMAGVTLPRSQGRVLVEALTHATAVARTTN